MKLGAVILAAGAGTRMGGVAKALLRLGERSYLEAIVATARAAGTTEIVVVVAPPHGEAVAAAAGAVGASCVANPDPSRGMASSVALGFAAVADRADAAWLWPVDHPAVQLATLQALLAADAHDVVRPRFGERHGHPPLVGRALFAPLMRCAELPGGARDVLASARSRSIDVADRGVIADVDTPDDARALA